MQVRGSVHSAVLFETPAEMFARVWTELRPDGKAPELEVRFRRFTGPRSTIRMREGRVLVHISDLLNGAPAPVLEALAFILLAKLMRCPAPAQYRQTYQRYLNRSDVRQKLHRVRQLRGRKSINGPQGQCFDLEPIFDELNRRFFNGQLRRPALGWSNRDSRTRLGHYDPAHDTIVISRLLDRPQTPLLVVEYILFHEMLHLKYPVEFTGTRRRIHTKEFREAEKAFPELDRAKALLAQL